MLSSSAVVIFSALAGYVNAHAAIINAQGEAGSPASVGFRVIPDLARNCTSISPCQQDATLIRDQEIKQNIVNPCGRTELHGNIDVGEETENALAAKAVTAVKPGTVITMTIHQVNADGAGPFFCDLDETSNAAIFQNLSVTDNVPGQNGLSQAKAQQFQVKVTMPDNLNCIGGSTGNVCTVRCRNAAQAGPFGGCFAVQQTDKAGNKNVPSNIQAVKDLDTVNSQVAQNKKDFEAANKAIQNLGTPEASQVADALAKVVPDKVVLKDFPVETPNVQLGAPAGAAPATGGNNAGNNNNNNAAGGNRNGGAAAGRGGKNNSNGNGRNNRQ